MIRPTWYALGNLGSNIFSQTFATFILFFYIDHLHAPLAGITLAMTIQSVWHAVLNPVIGQISDRTKSRYGRRIPYIAGMSIPLGLIFFLLWHPLVSQKELSLYFLIMVLLFDLTYLTVVLNWTSLFPEMFQTIGERTRAQSPRQIVGVIALLIGVASPPLLYGHWGWTVMGAILSGIGTLGFLLSLHGSHERVHAPSSSARFSLIQSWNVLKEFKGFRRFLLMNFLIQLTLGLVPAVLPFYAKYVLHLSHGILSILLASIFVIALFCIVPWTHIIERIGSHQGIRWTIGLLAVGLLPFLLLGNLPGIFGGAVVLGAGLGGFLVLADVLMAEVIDWDAHEGNIRREGLFYGINGFILRLGVSIQAVLLYIVLHSTGFKPNPTGVASIAVQDGFRLLMGFIPLVFLFLAYIVIRRYDVPPSPFTLGSD
ncbi:MAG: MFS transporter [Sulfobacillus thermosulfidooxidans]|uniref:MFS transporter n=1 Tax=Sulfobacillus thermosulfidooxidans TaxID=28034 RepID=A0A2T2WXA6_SULTH|nr:MAG: MFS transporter [Sulfobacillus thermosulfidooxidans]